MIIQIRGLKRKKGVARGARGGSAPEKLPVLLVLHQENSTPGRVGHALTALGYPLDIRRPRFGDPLPETMEGHAAAVVFGGPQSANDEEDYVRREIDWFGVPIAEQKPVLSICLGAQMMARTLGARVFCHVDQRAEVGYYPIRPTPEAMAMPLRWPERVYQWHREGFDLPPGAVMLAEGDEHFPVQAFRYGPAAFGIQFHPEVTHAMMCRWTVRGQHRFELPGAQDRAAHFAGRPVYDYSIRTWLKGFLDHWLPLGANASPGEGKLSKEARRVVRGFEGAMSDPDTTAYADAAE
jgi:GMP synthase (glutamine-hydrolysing)